MARCTEIDSSHEDAADDSHHTLICACHSKPNASALAASGKTCDELHAEIGAAEKELRRLKFKKDNAFSLGGYLRAPFQSAKAGGLLAGALGVVLYPIVSGSYTDEDEQLRKQSLLTVKTQVKAAKRQGCKKPGSGNEGLGEAILLLNGL